jgi:hypothetical protein
MVRSPWVVFVARLGAIFGVVAVLVVALSALAVVLGTWIS